MYDSIPGMAAAQRAYDNMEDPRLANECDCPELWVCYSCDDTLPEPGTCDHEDCVASRKDEGLGRAERVYVEREDSTLFADPKCSTHGHCTGCSSRWCEDCNG